MGKTISAATIKSHRTYSIQEASLVTGASVQTIRNWVRKGMPIIPDTRPWLIKGVDLKAMARGSRRPKMSQPAAGEMTCMKCRASRKVAGDMVDYLPHDAKTGRLVGLCQTCGTVMNLFVSKKKLPNFAALFDIQERGDRND